MADDLGFSDIGCYGGEIDTPHLDRLGRQGTRFTQFYNSPRCSPSRASLLTGLQPHQVGIGILTGDERPFGYAGNLSEQCITAAEALREAGYGTYMSGKWHVTADMTTPNPAWPTRRGFDRFYGTIDGAGSFFDPCTLTRDEQSIQHETADPGFFYTDAISANAAEFVDEHHATRPSDPFFLYVAYTAPHWPLHAHEPDIARYHGRYDAGWDQLRTARMKRLIGEGILSEHQVMSDRDPEVPSWDSVEHQEWEARRMEVYAAQVSRMDAGVGRLLSVLERTGRLDNTLFVFLSDNGGCAEDIPGDPDGPFAQLPIVPPRTRAGDPVRLGNTPQLIPGPESTYCSYGRNWANLSNTPFREYKHWVHEGGISTPLIVHWPAALGTAGQLCPQPRQLVDLLPTFLAAAQAERPDHRAGVPVPPLEGASMLPLLFGDDGTEVQRELFWEHEGNAGLRRGRWKLVRKHAQRWELYDMDNDRTELHDLAAEHPQLVTELQAAYEVRAERYGVIPRERVLEGYTHAHTR